MKTANKILISDCIFTAEKTEPFSGYVAITDNKISSVGVKEDAKEWAGNKTEIIELGDKTVMPGCVDNHTFFTGNILKNLGADLSNAKNEAEVIVELKKYAKNKDKDSPLYGHGWRADCFGNPYPDASILDREFHDRPVALFTEARDNCWLNTSALNRYGFNRSELHFEFMAKLLREYMSEPKFVRDEYKKFIKLMNRKGITSVKDIGYDDFYGVLHVLKDMEDNNEMTLRENFAFESVEQPFDLNFISKIKDAYNSPFLKFQGISFFTDGCIGDLKANMLEPYPCRPDTCTISPYNYGTLEEFILEADKRGIRITLHAQGDSAVRQCVDLLEKCDDSCGVWTIDGSLW